MQAANAQRSGACVPLRPRSTCVHAISHSFHHLRLTFPLFLPIRRGSIHLLIKVLYSDWILTHFSFFSLISGTMVVPLAR